MIYRSSKEPSQVCEWIKHSPCIALSLIALGLNKVGVAIQVRVLAFAKCFFEAIRFTLEAFILIVATVANFCTFRQIASLREGVEQEPENSVELVGSAIIPYLFAALISLIAPELGGLITDRKEKDSLYVKGGKDLSDRFADSFHTKIFTWIEDRVKGILAQREWGCFSGIKARLYNVLYLIAAIVVRVLEFAMGVVGAVFSILLAVISRFTSAARVHTALGRLARFTLKQLTIVTLVNDVFCALGKIINPKSY